jgi:tetratricopeptide (TPR) repeat protein
MMRRAVRAAVMLAVLAAPTAPVLSQQGSPSDAATLAGSGSKALAERRYADALTAFLAAAKLAPRNASIAFGAGLSAYMLGRNAEAEQQLSTALRLDPALKDASIVLGELQYRSGRIADAVATYEAALKRSPGDARLAEKIQQWSKEAAIESRFAETRGAHFRVRFEGPVDQLLARRTVEMLEAAYLRIGDALRFYPAATIEVVLYTAQQFRDVTRGPAWAVGAYDGRIRVPVKGALAQPGELERVLAHEYVHAVIAGVATTGVPAWVNEGLALVFESRGGTAPRVTSPQNRPRLSELHAGFGRLSDAMASIAYAESANAATAMLAARGPSAVMTLLRDLGAGAPFATAFHQRIGVRYEEFQDALMRR